MGQYAAPAEFAFHIRIAALPLPADGKPLFQRGEDVGVFHAHATVLPGIRDSPAQGVRQRPRLL